MIQRLNKNNDLEIEIELTDDSGNITSLEDTSDIILMVTTPSTPIENKLKLNKTDMMGNNFIINNSQLQQLEEGLLITTVTIRYDDDRFDDGKYDFTQTIQNNIYIY